MKTLLTMMVHYTFVCLCKYELWCCFLLAFNHANAYTYVFSAVSLQENTSLLTNILAGYEYFTQVSSFSSLYLNYYQKLLEIEKEIVREVALGG